MHLDSWDSHPRVVLTQMPPLVATAHVLLRFNARPVAGHKYHYPFRLLSPSSRIAPFRQSPEDLELLVRVFALMARPLGQQKESKRYADIQLSRNNGACRYYPSLI